MRKVLMVGILVVAVAAIGVAAFMLLRGGETQPPKPKPEPFTAIVGEVRVQVLSETLVRLEVKGRNGFEDRATYHITGRDWEGAEATMTQDEAATTIVTPRYTVTLPNDAATLDEVVVSKTDGTELWRGDVLPESTQFLPEPAKTPDAWAIIDAPRVVPAEWGYQPAPAEVTDIDFNGWDVGNNATDVYVFVPLGEPVQLRTDFVALTGRSTLIPLKALGLWHSRYYAYTEQEVYDTIDRYRAEGFPIDTFVVDTDWRVNASTGYEVNTKCFPDLPTFFMTAHNEKHVNIVFNDHPEPQLNLQALSKKELNYRYENLTAILQQGLDAWWFDRNWHTTIKSPFEGISKESFGMYLYENITATLRPDQRPMIMGNIDGIDDGAFSRAPNLASHRFTLQWTGDIGNNSTALKKEIQNTVNSGALAATPYVSADVGGHMGEVSPNQWIRWVQYAALSPIFRFHCTSGETLDRAPWLYGEQAQAVAQVYIGLRYRLLPVFYNLSHVNYMTGLPLTRRLDFHYPQHEESRDDTQYLLGEDILVAPIYRNGNNGAPAAREFFIPDGTWIDVWTGERITGPQTVERDYELERSPIFVRAGAILTLVDNVAYIGEKPWDVVTLDIYPDAAQKNTAVLYEDDGLSNDYQNGKYRTTEIAMQGGTVTIGKAVGSFDGSDSFTARTWRVRLHVDANGALPKSVTVDGKAQELTVVAQDNAAEPFAFDGAARDGDVVEVVFTAKLTAESVVEFNY